jgi:hypothetical protein
MRFGTLRSMRRRVLADEANDGGNPASLYECATRRAWPVSSRALPPPSSDCQFMSMAHPRAWERRPMPVCRQFEEKLAMSLQVIGLMK